ncbi:hypothetical protein HMPREF3190_00204 [Umbribacter vaginalis]|nr:hypothetical protein HMPREF3190_00204 [Coriobacteriales bacterium DNF00809]
MRGIKRHEPKWNYLCFLLEHLCTRCIIAKMTLDEMLRSV